MNVIRIELQRSRSWKDQASNLDAWERWDRSKRRAAGWRAGLSFWHRTNTPGSYTLLARHWPHRLCWSWSIWVGKWRRRYDGPRRVALTISRPYRFAEVWLIWGYARLSWQDYDWMPAMNCRGEAPQMYWKHHLENAVAAGSA